MPGFWYDIDMVYTRGGQALRLRSGQVALPFVLLVGGVIIEIVIAGSFVSFFVSATSIGERLSVRALAAANTGIYDAVMRVSRDKEFGAVEVNYDIAVSSDSVSVTVSRTSDDANNIYLYSVLSVASARSRQRKVVAEVVVDQTTGAISIDSIQEQAVQ